jgi:isopentenyl diphosphate isomerase/L-lactate dehydrogenase-like FMN-dependent dehydrogenase
LAAATESAEAVTARLNIVLQQLRVAMFCAGAARLEDLTPNLLQEHTREP